MNKLTGILTVIILFSFHLLSFGQVITLKEKISIQLKNTTAAQVIEELDKQSDYSFSYTREQLDKITIRSFVFENTSLGNALDNLQRMANLEFNLLGATIAVKVNAKPAAAPVQANQNKPGKIAGIIRNEQNEVMPGVSVSVESINKTITSSINGDYVLSLPPGTYALQFSFVGYQPRQITDVVVKDDEITDLDIVLTAASKQMQAVVVTSGARRESTRSLLMAQKNNASMTNGISAEQIRVTPDNNTAQVLKRVSGITVQGEKFVTIRGVSDRYNNVLINGATLPSTEPNRRNFSFDIVPSALVDNIVVNKTASPDLPGEFTGGLVQINTKDVPLKNFLTVTIGTGFNTASMGRDFISYKRDKNAALGIVDKDRKWFGDGRAFDPVEYNTQVNRQKDTAYRNRVGGMIPNRWQPYNYKYSPVQNYQLAGGLTKRFEEANSLGVVGAVIYRNELLLEDGESRAVQQSDFTGQRYRYNTTIGGILNVAYKTKRHKLAFKNLYNYKYSNQFDEQVGSYISQAHFAKRRSEVTLTNELLHSRLEGEHVIGNAGIKVDWFGDHIQLDRNQPDTRFITGLSRVPYYNVNNDRFVDDGRYVYNFNDALLFQNGLYSSQLKERRKNAGGNISLPFTVAGAKQLFKTGYLWSERKADFDGTGLKIQHIDNYTATKAGLPYYEIATPEAFRNGNLQYFAAYARAGTTGDRYEGTQILQGMYGMLDLKLLTKLRLTGGLRYEDNKMKLSTVFYNDQGFSQFKDTVYNEKDWLPSVNIIYSLTDKFNIRGAYSKTLARPDFVERSPYIYYDFVELAEVVGQYALEVSRIRNYDLRFEYYPSGNEILSASVFYKDFDKPVERFYNLGSASNSIQYKNLYSATAKGFELDARKSLGFISPGSKWLQNLFISGNYTYLKGEIKYIITTVPGTQKDTFIVADGNRPIQGLSPYIINGGLNYQAKMWGFNISYNRFGRRLVNGGTNFSLNQYENPRDIVDLQISTKVLKQKGEIKFNVADLLNQYYIIYSNNVNKDGNQFPGEKPSNAEDPKGDAFNESIDFVNYKVKKGTGFSIIFSYSF